MIRTLRALPLLLPLLVLAGCGSTSGRVILVNDIEIYEQVWSDTIRELSPRAGFDLHCQAEQLQFILFRRAGRTPVEVGVVGCGQGGRGGPGRCRP